MCVQFERLFRNADDDGEGNLAAFPIAVLNTRLCAWPNSSWPKKERTDTALHFKTAKFDRIVHLPFCFFVRCWAKDVLKCSVHDLGKNLCSFYCFYLTELNKKMSIFQSVTKNVGFEFGLSKCKKLVSISCELYLYFMPSYV